MSGVLRFSGGRVRINGSKHKRDGIFLTRQLSQRRSVPRVRFLISAGVSLLVDGHGLARFFEFKLRIDLSFMAFSDDEVTAVECGESTVVQAHTIVPRDEPGHGVLASSIGGERTAERGISNGDHSTLNHGSRGVSNVSVNLSVGLPSQLSKSGADEKSTSGD